MIFYKTLIHIRKRHDLSRAEFALALECTEEHITALEENKVQATFAFVVKIKDVFNLHTAPIFESERNTLMERLFNWKKAIDYAYLDVAERLKPELEQKAKSSYSPSTEIFYDLFAADYYYHVRDDASYDETMAALSQRKDEFSARHFYHYNRLLGAKAFVDKRYQDAIKAYKTAEKLDAAGNWHDVRFYTGLGASLSDRGYATRAVEYLKKAQHMAKWDKAFDDRRNKRFDAYIDGYLANDLSKIGRSDDALKILGRRFEVETKINSKEGIGYTHFSLGRVYQRLENYDLAIENCNKALEHLDENGAWYVACLYCKASILIDSGRVAEVAECTTKGRSVATDDLWETVFDAVEHFTKMHDHPESATYLGETLVPKLISLGQYEEAIHYYQHLSILSRENGDIDTAFEYNYSALELYKKLHKERIEGDM